MSCVGIDESLLQAMRSSGAMRATARADTERVR
jgi:hypothetical protein